MTREKKRFIILYKLYVSIPSVFYGYNKTVSSTPVSYETSDTTTATEVVTENAAGEEGKVSGIQINGAHKTPTAAKTPSVANTSRAPVTSSSGGGGGSSSKEKEPSKPSKTALTKQNEIV